MSDLDKTINALFDQLSAKKAALAAAEKQLKTEYPGWKTNCNFRSPATGETTNITTADLAAVVTITGQIHLQKTAQQLGAEFLEKAGIPIAVTGEIQGYPLDQWLHDLVKRGKTIRIREQKVEIEKLDARLNAVVSPEERRRLEVEALAREITS